VIQKGLINFQEQPFFRHRYVKSHLKLGSFSREENKVSYEVVYLDLEKDSLLSSQKFPKHRWSRDEESKSHQRGYFGQRSCSMYIYPILLYTSCTWISIIFHFFFLLCVFSCVHSFYYV